MGVEDPWAIHNLSLPEQVVYGENFLDKSVMWFVGPESIIRDVKYLFVPFPE
jgi:hypothetical protein